MDLFSDDSGVISIEDLRTRLFRLCILRVVLAMSLLGFFWAAYSWIIIFAFLTLTTGGIGVTHFSSLESLYHSQCCCAPRPAVVFLYYTSIISLPLSVICTMSCVFATTGSEGTARTLAAISLLICVIMSLCESIMLVACKRLRLMMDSDQQFGFAANQISPETIAVIRHSSIRGDPPGGPLHGERPSVVRVLVDPVGGLVLDHSNDASAASNRLPLRDRNAPNTEADEHELQYVIGQPVYGYPVVSQVPTADANGCPGTDGSPASAGAGRLPPFVTTTGTLGYASSAAADREAASPPNASHYAV